MDFAQSRTPNELNSVYDQLQSNPGASQRTSSNDQIGRAPFLNAVAAMLKIPPLVEQFLAQWSKRQS
jgi:hypothetical protein